MGKSVDRYSEIRKHLHIVSCGDTANALGVVRSLGEIGIHPIVLCVEGANHHPCLVKSKYIGNLIRYKDSDQVIDILLEHYGSEFLKPFVYVCDDCQVSLYDNRYDELKDKFYFFHGGERGSINRYLNKENICKVAESCGCRIPLEEVVDTGELPKTLTYPIITKTLTSNMGLWKSDSYICKNEDELRDAYTKIKAPKLLLQEYIQKKNELAIMGYSVGGGSEVYVPYQLSYIRCPEGAYGRYMYFSPIKDEQLRNTIRQILQQCHFSGCFEIEFLITPSDNLVFLEVNFRYSFWNYAVTYGGINYPAEWAKATLDNHIDDQYLDSQRMAYFTAIDEVGDFGSNVMSKRISIWKWMHDIWSADVRYFWNDKDIMPTISFWWHKIAKKLKLS